MAENWIEMQVVTVTPTGRDRKFAYEIQVDTTGIDTSKWILIPEDISSIAVTISFSSGGRGKVQATTDILSVVKANTNVVTKDWALGVVSRTTQDSVVPVTAIRLKQTSETGSSKLTVRAQ